MQDQPLPLGTLYIAAEVFNSEKWLYDQAIAAAKLQLNKYVGLHGFLKPSIRRLGDFSLILSTFKMTPVVASFIGIPGRGKSAIVEDLFVASP